MASVNCIKAMSPLLIALSIWCEMSNILHYKINNISILILHCSGCKKCFCRLVMLNGLLGKSARQLFDIGSTFSSHGQYYSFQNMDPFCTE